uniref:C-type lectin domain-containing protein n=1 Tax=Acrobeloides nanus TaxID=290746 RepID=A0A914C5K5_9BILA
MDYFHAPANGSTAAPLTAATAAPATGSTAAPATAATAAPTTRSTAAPPSTRPTTTTTTTTKVSLSTTTSRTTKTTQKATTTTSLPVRPTTTFIRPTCCPSDLTRTGQPTSNVDSGVWIGLKAVVTAKSFVWTDGSPVHYTKWAVRPSGIEPDGVGQFGSPANCVVVHPDTLIGDESLTNAWDDDNCVAVMRAFVCKQSVQNC